MLHLDLSQILILSRVSRRVEAGGNGGGGAGAGVSARGSNPRR